MTPRHYYLKEPADACPAEHCGAQGLVQIFLAGRTTIKCANRDCETRPTVHADTEDEALKAWRALARD